MASLFRPAPALISSGNGASNRLQRIAVEEFTIRTVSVKPCRRRTSLRTNVTVGALPDEQKNGVHFDSLTLKTYEVISLPSLMGLTLTVRSLAISAFCTASSFAALMETQSCTEPPRVISHLMMACEILDAGRQVKRRKPA